MAILSENEVLKLISRKVESGKGLIVEKSVSYSLENFLVYIDGLS